MRAEHLDFILDLVVMRRGKGHLLIHFERLVRWRARAEAGALAWVAARMERMRHRVCMDGA